MSKSTASRAPSTRPLTNVAAVAEIISTDAVDVSVYNVVRWACFADDSLAVVSNLAAVRLRTKVLYTCPDIYQIDGQGIPVFPVLS